MALPFNTPILLTTRTIPGLIHYPKPSTSIVEPIAEVAVAEKSPKKSESSPAFRLLDTAGDSAVLSRSRNLNRPEVSIPFSLAYSILTRSLPSSDRHFRRLLSTTSSISRNTRETFREIGEGATDG